MTALNAFLAGAGMAAMGGMILYFRRLLRGPLLAALLLGALFSSAASAIVVELRRTNSGVAVNRGYPKPYYFQTVGSGASFEALYFGANTTMHFGALALLAAALSGRRSGSGTGGPVLIRMALGFLFLILGVIGAFLPILQGWVFFLLAFLVFFPRSPLTEKTVRKLEGKMPRFARFLRRMGIGDAEWRDSMRAE